MNPSLYPPSPEFVPAEKLNPSPAFKKQVTKVITSIICFFIVYLVLISAAVVLAVACCYIGMQLIINVPRFITIIAGVGLVAVGLSVIYFLIKFIFAVSKNENPNRVEIREQDQPELFAFIRQLSTETKTAFPKKIFLSPDVNACVFYNSSFWSMFFPVRKNLEIGLGLVNSINISELKAVIAHEFGHFSQRSMKLGSFTYNVNRIIYNMLYENNSYTSFLNAWGNLHGLLSVFALTTFKIAEGIQYVLRAMYQLINRNYMGLSREMEFHADAVAASVAGGNNVITGLSRIELADHCYNTTLTRADALLKEKKMMTNIYDNQLTIFRHVGSKYTLTEKQGLPEVSFEFIRSFSTSRINYKNQWASHPELHERKANLEMLDITVPADETPAWIIFANKQDLQEQATAKLYSQVENAAQMQPADAGVFNEWYRTENETYTLPEAYNGYYDGRYIQTKDWDFAAMAVNKPAIDFDEIFTKEHAQLQQQINSSLADIETLKAISQKQINVKSFDFDGTKYGRRDCNNIIEQLEEEIKQKQQILAELDKTAFVFFCTHVSNIAQLYTSYREVESRYDDYVNAANSLLNAIAPLYKGGLTVQEVYPIVSQLKEIHEKHFKLQVGQLLDDGILNEAGNNTLHNEAQDFMQKDYRYFFNDEFRNDELNQLANIALSIGDAYNTYKFKRYKKVLETQLALYKTTVHAIITEKQTV